MVPPVGVSAGTTAASLNLTGCRRTPLTPADLRTLTASSGPVPGPMYTGSSVTFRERLLGTLRQLRPVREEPGVLVVGSEVPNLPQPGALATLVVSQDVGVAIPVDRVDTVKPRLQQLQGLVPSPDDGRGGRGPAAVRPVAALTRLSIAVAVPPAAKVSRIARDSQPKRQRPPRRSDVTDTASPAPAPRGGGSRRPATRRAPAGLMRGHR